MFIVFVSFLIVALITKPIIIIATKTGMIAKPLSDRWHTKPTALLGGIGIFIGIIGGIIFQGIYLDIPIWFFFGAFIVFLSGLYDDIKGMLPYTKLFFQIIGAIFLIYSGFLFGMGILPYYISIPLTILWIVGITNAMNLLDNMDGLCAGTCAITSFSLGILFFLSDQTTLMTLSFIICGSCCGFLIFNFSPAKIFMGDCGSLLLGYLLSGITIMGNYQSKSNILLSIGIPLFIMALPIFDTTLVTLSRRYLNLSISQGGKDHSSHRLISLGYSEINSLLLMYTVTILGGGIAIALSYLDISISILLIIIALVLFVGSGAFLSRVRVYSEEDYNAILKHKIRKESITFIRSVLSYKRQIMAVISDSIFVLYSLYFTLWLQYFGEIPPQIYSNFPEIIISILPYSLLLFFSFGFYRYLGRYVAMDDLLRIIFTVTIFVISIYFILPIIGIIKLHLTTAFIFGMVLTFLLSLYRFSERILFTFHNQIVNKNDKSMDRVLIVGAGDTANIVLREINQNLHLKFNPVGIVDDDLSKRHSRIGQYPVLGDISMVPEIVKNNFIDKIIIAITNIDNFRMKKIIEKCRISGKSILFARVTIDRNHEIV